MASGLIEKMENARMDFMASKQKKGEPESAFSFCLLSRKTKRNAADFQ
jgi:hypothetical protein